MPLDPTLPSAAAVFAAAMNEHVARAHLQAPIEENVLIAIAITIAIPLASVGRIVERRVKEMNVDLAHKADALAKNSSENGPFLGKIIAKGLWRFFSAYVVAGFVSLWVITWACGIIITKHEIYVERSLNGFYVILPLIAIGAALAGIRAKGSRVAFSVIALAITRF